MPLDLKLFSGKYLFCLWSSKVIYRCRMVLLVVFMLGGRAIAGEIVDGKIPGSILLRDKGREVLYRNVVGDKDGFGRTLINLNGAPVLRVSARYEYYYTLIASENKALIDCAYFNVRNIYNGAAASAGMCGLNIELYEGYDEIAQMYSNEWRSTIFSFDTGDILALGKGKEFSLGKIGEVEVFDRYSSVDALVNASPQKIIKSNSGCFNFGSVVGFLVFLKQSAQSPKYLDVLRSEEPMVIQRMQEQDLKRIAVDKCDS